MDKPESIIISESYAHKLFPKGNALGSYLYTEGNTGLVAGIDKFRICGIFKDLPENCQFKNDIFIRMSDFQKDDWGSMNFFAFFRLKPGVSATDINSQIEASGANKRLNIVDKGNQRLYVFPIQKLYYDMSASYYLKTGNRNTMILLVSIGLLIIIIACINLINFSTALAPVRMRSINTQKSIGQQQLGITPCLKYRISRHHLDQLVLITGHCRNTHTPEDAHFYGIHPFIDYLLAHYRIHRNHRIGDRRNCRSLSSMVHDFFPSGPRIERKLCPKRKRQTLRMFLIGFQYIVSFVLIVTAGFIFLQNRFMQNYISGIDKDQILVASLPQMPYQSSEYRNFTNTLKSFAEIDDIAYAKSSLGGENGYTQYAFLYKEKMYGQLLH